MQTEKSTLPDRSTWIAALAALPYAPLKALIEDLTKGYSIRYKALPQTGLGMLKLKESAFQEPYYLGEFPIASAWVEITTQDQQKLEGAAQVMDDNTELASMLATADAILANQLLGWERLAERLAIGTSLRKKNNQKRKAMLSKTRVDFSLLDATGSMGSE